jgi:predicted ferric reductase
MQTCRIVGEKSGAAPRSPTPGGYVAGDAPDSTDPITLARQVVEDAVRLARAELTVVGAELKRAVIQLAIAIALIMVAAVFMLIAVIEALNALPAGVGILGSEWIRWLALGGIFLILAGVLIFIGQSRARKAIKRGRKSVQDTLKEDAEWLRELTKRSVKGS